MQRARIGRDLRPRLGEPVQAVHQPGADALLKRRLRFGEWIGRRHAHQIESQRVRPLFDVFGESLIHASLHTRSIRRTSVERELVESTTCTWRRIMRAGEKTLDPNSSSILYQPDCGLPENSLYCRQQAETELLWPG